MVVLTSTEDPIRPNYFHNMAHALQLRSPNNQNLNDLEKAVTLEREAIVLTPEDHHNRALALNSLGYTLVACSFKGATTNSGPVTLPVVSRQLHLADDFIIDERTIVSVHEFQYMHEGYRTCGYRVFSDFI